LHCKTPSTTISSCSRPWSARSRWCFPPIAERLFGAPFHPGRPRWREQSLIPRLRAPATPRPEPSGILAHWLGEGGSP
jgi:hypothetical protein